MHRIRCAALVAVAVFGFACIASAADMPVKAPVYKAPAAEPSSSWTGWYVGANAGYGWNDRDRTVTFTPADALSAIDTCGGANGGTCPQPASFSSINGALGGLQVGYNWQFKQNWVAGIEADFDWSRIKGAGTSNFILGNFPVGPIASNFVADQNVKWFGTIRGRLGFVPANNVLIYGTAGFAYGRVEQNVALNSQPGPGDFGLANAGFICSAGPNCFLGSSSRTATGWTAGGGFEYALWRNVSVKGEYLYVNLGSGGNTINVVAVSSNGQPRPSSFTANYSGGDLDFHTVRLGINFRF
jgi:outer membrane immunogenic protein